MLILSAHTGIAPATVTLSATAENFELEFPDDLVTLINAFQSFLGHQKAYGYLPENPAVQAFYAVEAVGGDEGRDNPIERLVGFRIHVYAPFPVEASGNPVAPMLFRLARILRFNRWLDHTGGIIELHSLTTQTGSDFTGPYDTTSSAAGVINLVYALTNPVPHE